MASGFVEVEFFVIAEFEGRVDEAVVIVRAEIEIGCDQRARDVPLARHLAEVDRHRSISGVDGIHQYLSEIQEGMMCVQLSAKRSGRVEVNLIFDSSAL